MGENTSSKRTQGWEWRAVGWALRHPVISLGPVAATAGTIAMGPATAGTIGGGLAMAALGWYRGHPDTWDKWVTPKLRATRRRWLSRTYLGPWWVDTMTACGLAVEDRTTKEFRVPRILRIRSYSASTETVHIKILKGQSMKALEEALPALTEALGADRVAIERIRPMVFALIVQRGEPFAETILPPDIIDDTDGIDLTSLYLGETEQGSEWRVPVVGQHILVAGASGSGKNSITGAILRQLAPLIRDGLVRVWCVDPKGVEMEWTKPFAYRYACEVDDVVALISEYKDTLDARKTVLAGQGKRTFVMSRETPLDILLIDEIGTVTGYGGGRHSRGLLSDLGIILSQFRALGGSVIAALQEPSKDVLPVRDLFTMRVILRATTAAHVDMVLGEDMRKRGALADEIPNVPDSAGIGYVVNERSRTPLRVRACYCDDTDNAATARVASWPNSELTTHTTEEANDDVDIDAT